jgi:hypothetical protein
LVERALKTAIDNLADDTTLEPALREGLDLDKDTKNVPGNPPIFSTILTKIDKAAIFVPDLTSVAKRENGELIPNPNVLIEYGWALKSVGYHRIIPVMNVAYGNPRTESLPFDMAHLRFPITYDLPEGANDVERRTVRAALARELEDAIRTVFGSDEFQSMLPKLPLATEFPRQQALDGRARFRTKGKPIGIIREQMTTLTGEPASADLQLGEGAACWFRLMPTIDTGLRWNAVDLREKVLAMSIPQILHWGATGGFVRGADGAGHYSIEGGDTTRALIYLFKTGEIWMIDSWIAHVRYVELDERAFARTLEKCASFLANSLGLDGPYRWEAGFEGISGRMLTIRNGNDRGVGTAIEDFVEDSGVFDPGGDPAEALRLFFEKVFDCFGARR